MRGFSCVIMACLSNHCKICGEFRQDLGKHRKVHKSVEIMSRFSEPAQITETVLQTNNLMRCNHKNCNGLIMEISNRRKHDLFWHSEVLSGRKVENSMDCFSEEPFDTVEMHNTEVEHDLFTSGDALLPAHSDDCQPNHVKMPSSNVINHLTICQQQTNSQSVNQSPPSNEQTADSGEASGNDAQPQKVTIPSENNLNIPQIQPLNVDQFIGSIDTSPVFSLEYDNSGTYYVDKLKTKADSEEFNANLSVASDVENVTQIFEIVSLLCADLDIRAVLKVNKLLSAINSLANCAQKLSARDLEYAFPKTKETFDRRASVLLFQKSTNEMLNSSKIITVPLKSDKYNPEPNATFPFYIHDFLPAVVKQIADNWSIVTR